MQSLPKTTATTNIDSLLVTQAPATTKTTTTTTTSTPPLKTPTTTTPTAPAPEPAAPQPPVNRRGWSLSRIDELTDRDHCAGGSLVDARQASDFCLPAAAKNLTALARLHFGSSPPAAEQRPGKSEGIGDNGNDCLAAGTNVAPIKFSARTTTTTGNDDTDNSNSNNCSCNCGSGCAGGDAIVAAQMGDCCNRCSYHHRRRRANQFTATCRHRHHHIHEQQQRRRRQPQQQQQQQAAARPPRLRHKHLLLVCCADEPRREGERAPTNSQSTMINNALASRVDESQRRRRPALDDGDARATLVAADHSYDTRPPLFSNGVALHKPKPAPAADHNTIDDDNNSRIGNDENNDSVSLTTDCYSLASGYVSPSPSATSTAAVEVNSIEKQQQKASEFELHPSGLHSAAPQPLAPDSTRNANETPPTTIGQLLSQSSPQLLSQSTPTNSPSPPMSRPAAQLSQQRTIASSLIELGRQQQHQAEADAAESMDDGRLQAPVVYPNNTLIADLNKCHPNVANFWPRTTQATATTLAGCWPLPSSLQRHFNGQKRLKRSRYNFHMPESLLRTNARLKPDEYDRALSVLTSDVRYQLHLLLYRQVHTIWILMSTILCLLVGVLFANFELLLIIGACCFWLGLQIIGAIVGMQTRKKLDQMLEKSIAQVNSFFMDHNLMLGVINVGGLVQKAKLAVPMLYFDTSQCREQIESIISIDSRKDADGNNDNNNKHILDYSKIDLPLTKPNAVALAQSQLAKKIVLRYSQRWISYFDKRKLMFIDERTRPRHLSTGKCLCQFIEEQFKNTDKPTTTVGQAKHNQATFINSYANAKATLALNGAGKQELQQQQQVETRVKPHVISRLWAAPTEEGAPTLATLSGLVSLNEEKDDEERGRQRRPEHLRIDMSLGQEVHQPTSNGCGPGQWRPQSAHDGRASVDEAPLGLSHQHTAAVSSSDVSLEMGSDLIGRGDDLVRKLRFLLELRKNELHNIEGSLFSSVLYKVPNGNSSIMDGDIGDHGLPSTTGAVSNEPPASGGKKFFSQGEGLFFLGSNGAKKSQQQGAGRNHVLEIC